MDIVLGLIIVGIALAVAFGLQMRKRNELDVPAAEEKPKRMSKREKKLEEIRANEPDIVIPSIDDLVREEIEETGVNQIAGGEELADPTKLKVYRRDIAGLEGCPRENLQFKLSYGISAADATEDNVRLVCNEDGHVHADVSADAPASAGAEGDAAAEAPDAAAAAGGDDSDAATEMDTAEGH